MNLDGFSKKYAGTVYLDSAATSLTPLDVVKAGTDYYMDYNANPHRGMYHISERASYEWEGSRCELENWINTDNTPNGRLAFVSGATMGLNIIAWNWSRWCRQAVNDIRPARVHIGPAEHHSNIVNWQTHDIDIVSSANWEDFLEGLRHIPPGLVSVSHYANTTGVEAPVDKLWEICESRGHFLFLDCCQTPAHHPLPADYCHGFTFSAHKMYGPNGIGGLWFRDTDKYSTNHKFCQPMIAGGGIVDSVSLGETQLKQFPQVMEAGTGNVPGVTGLRAAKRFVERQGYPNLQAHSHALCGQTIESLSDICDIYVEPSSATSIVPFNVQGVHPSDVATLLGIDNICVRSGKLCAEPYVTTLNPEGIVRASFGVYNTAEDVEVFVDAVRTIHSRHS